jgi:acyl-CoA thioesterase FadM
VKAQRDELRDKFFALAHRLTTGPTAILSAESGITLMALDEDSYLKLMAMDQRRVSVLGAT